MHGIKRFAPFIFIILGIVFPMSEIEEEFTRSVDLFNNNKIENSIESLNSIIENGFESAEIYYNLGCSYYKIVNYPLSIWSFEQAIKLDPLNQDAQYNLSLVKSKLDIPIIPEDILIVKYYSKIKKLFPLTQWVIVSLSILCIIASMHFINWFKIEIFNPSIIMTINVIFVISLLLSLNVIWNSYHSNEAIVVSSKVKIYYEPNIDSEQLLDSFIQAGKKVIIKTEIPNWVEISIDRRRTGWMRSSEVKLIRN
jgi:tetratricopeptide (TPR) repeat protein